MGLHDRIKSGYLAFDRVLRDNPLMDLKWFVEQEVDTWEHWVGLPPRRRLWLWRHGFTSPFGKLYDFGRYGPDLYLSERQRNRLYGSLNGRHRYLLDDKLSQHWMMADYPDHRPTAYGFLDRGRVHGLSGTVFEGDPTPVREWLPDALREHSRLVLKDLRGKGGKEVHVVTHDGTGFALDGQRITEDALCDRVEGLSGYLVSEYVEQHGYASELYPHSPNTVRVVTLWDDRAGELSVPIVVQRIGTERSRPVDNFSSGGLSAEVDVETGELGPAAQYPFSGEVPWYGTHPDTDAPIEGVSVPNWEAVLSTVAAIARDNTHVPLVGWDVLLNEAGEPVIIEANTGTTLGLLQVHRPLLADPQFAAVAARHLPEVDGTTPAVPPSTGRRTPDRDDPDDGTTDPEPPRPGDA